VQESSSEYLLFAAAVEAAVRTVTLPTVIQVVHVFVGIVIVQIVVDHFSTYRGW